MSDRAALITGASSGIGLAIADVLGREGYGITVAARRPEKLETAAEGLRTSGFEVEAVAADLSKEDSIRAVVGAHRERFGRLDVLVNNAGVGIGQHAEELTTKAIDLQVATNLRAIFLFYREALPLLRESAAEHRNAIVVNVSSASGKQGEAWIGVYSATKAGLIGYTQAMNRELAGAGIKSTALCPAFVDTPMAVTVKEQIGAEAMITVGDIAGFVRYLVTTSPGCLIPEIPFDQTSGWVPPNPVAATATS